MTLTVGRVYLAEMPNEPMYDGWQWQVLIVAKVEKGGEPYWVGLVNKNEPGNQTAKVFDEFGEQADLEINALGMKIFMESRAKPRWTIL